MSRNERHDPVADDIFARRHHSEREVQADERGFAVQIATWHPRPCRGTNCTRGGGQYLVSPVTPLAAL